MLYTSRIIILVLSCSLLAEVTKAQLPQKNLVYIEFTTDFYDSDSLYNYDPSLPVSASNPWINTIQLPANNVGLAISPVLGSGDSTLTYYTGVDGNYCYYDPVTHAWINTGHFYGSTSAVNFAGGGGYLYSLDGFTGIVCRFDGVSDAVLVAICPDPFPFDLVADCEGNFYVITNDGPFNLMDEFDPDGTFVQQWTVVNPSGWVPSGGMANIGNNIYTDIEFQHNLAHATVTGGNVVFDTSTANIPLMLATDFVVADMGSYGGPPLSNILPTINITASATSVCKGDSVFFAAAVTNNGTDPRYQWFKNDLPIPGATDSTYAYTPDDSDVVSVQLVTDGGCSNVTSISPSIILNTFSVTATLSYGSDSFCSNMGNIHPRAALPPAGKFASMTGLVIDSVSGIIDVAATLPGSYIVTYTTDQDGCVATAQDTLQTALTPIINLSVSNTNVCDGDTVQLAFQDDSSYNVSLLSGGYFILADNNVSALLSVKQSGFINVKITNLYCSNQDSVYINTHSCCDLILPDAFTPNKDGRNDLFGPLVTGHYAIQQFIIKNRWGQTVFQSFGHNPCWDGTLNEVPAEMGTYFYYLSYNCDGSQQMLEKEGDVILIR